MTVRNLAVVATPRGLSPWIDDCGPAPVRQTTAAAAALAPVGRRLKRVRSAHQSGQRHLLRGYYGPAAGSTRLPTGPRFASKSRRRADPATGSLSQTLQHLIP